MIETRYGWGVKPICRVDVGMRDGQESVGRGRLRGNVDACRRRWSMRYHQPRGGFSFTDGIYRHLVVHSVRPLPFHSFKVRVLI